MRQPTDIELKLEPLLEATPYELVWVEVSKGGNVPVVRVFLDRKGGISIDDITTASRQISAYLDVEFPMLGQYLLEVSSPGLDRPLMRPKHFINQVGQKLSVHLHIALEGRRNFRGILQKATETGIDLLVDEQVFTFCFEDIDKARVVPDIRIGSGQERQNHEH